jgi:hypothetical protein
MAQNPLQEYFRQPKIFVSLPSQGAYSKPGTFDGPTENLPVYGMTGMDEIIMKTPDALLSGESTVRVIESCCPTIKNAWELSNIDTDLILTAIRIATYGNSMTLTQPCQHCEVPNDYELDLTKLIDHFTTCKFDSKIVIGNLVVKLHPLNYKQVTDFGIKNFQLQQQLIQSLKIEDGVEQKKVLAEIYDGLSKLQTDVFTDSIDCIEVDNKVVTEKPYIREWLENSDKSVYDAIKNQNERNKQTWKAPTMHVNCRECGKENTVNVELDQSNFFE